MILYGGVCDLERGQFYIFSYDAAPSEYDKEALVLRHSIFISRQHSTNLLEPSYMDRKLDMGDILWYYSTDRKAVENFLNEEREKLINELRTKLSTAEKNQVEFIRHVS